MREKLKAPLAVLAVAALLASPAPVAWLVLGDDVDFGGIQDLPLPGGADLGDHPYEVTAEFDNVVSLVPQSAVKVNDVSVGRITDIDLADDSWHARVTMKVNGSVRLPANSYARVEQSSLLGEKYVQLIAPPADEAEGVLGDRGDAEILPAAAAGGVDIPVSRTNRNPEVEEVFGALSMLLNGGGVQQLRTISRELNKALDGNETEVRSLLRRVDTLVTSLDDNKEDITAALDGINRLGATLAGRKREIGAVLEDLSPGLKVLERQRGSLMTMLRSLDRLSGVAVETIDRSKEDMVADLRAIGPILKNLADAGQALPESLEVLVTYPFTDAVLSGVKGDYLNVYLRTAAPPGTEVVPPIGEDPLPPPWDPSAVGGAGGPATAQVPLPLPAATPAPDGPEPSPPAGGSGGADPGEEDR